MKYEVDQCGKQSSRLSRIPLGYPMIQWATFRAPGTNRETKKKMLAGHMTNHVYTYQLKVKVKFTLEQTTKTQRGVEVQL